MLNRVIFLFVDRPLCSHLMATEYFAESIWSSTGFWGSKCLGYLQYMFGWCNDEEEDDEGDDDDDDDEEEMRPMFAVMGDKCDRKSRGSYYIVTNRKPPYAKGLLPLKNLFRDSEVIYSQEKI